MTLLNDLLALIDKSKDFPDEQSRTKAKNIVKKAFKEEGVSEESEEE